MDRKAPVSVAQAGVPSSRLNPEGRGPEDEAVRGPSRPWGRRRCLETSWLSLLGGRQRRCKQPAMYWTVRHAGEFSGLNVQAPGQRETLTQEWRAEGRVATMSAPSHVWPFPSGPGSRHGLNRAGNLVFSERTDKPKGNRGEAWRSSRLAGHYLQEVDPRHQAWLPRTKPLERPNGISLLTLTRQTRKPNTAESRGSFLPRRLALRLLQRVKNLAAPEIHTRLIKVAASAFTPRSLHLGRGPPVSASRTRDDGLSPRPLLFCPLAPHLSSHEGGLTPTPGTP